MNKLYEEALADAKQLREVAENSAKRAVCDAVTPKIRELVDKFLLGEDAQVDGVELLQGGDDKPETTLQQGMTGDASGNLYGFEPTPNARPEDEGMQSTSKADDNVEEGDGEYELNLESVEKLMPLYRNTNTASDREFELSVYKLGDTVKTLGQLAEHGASSRLVMSKIDETIARVQNMYDYVKETHGASDDEKRSIEIALEAQFKELNTIRENTMSKTRMNETNVNFQVTGVPDDAADALRTALSDPDTSSNLGIDIEVAGDEEGEEGGDEDLDLDAGGDEDLDVGGDEEGGGDEDFGDMDMGGDEEDMGGDEDDEDDEDLDESDMSDDDVVEIDEGMLRRELSRMQRLNEEKWPSEILSDFGGGKECCESFLDGEVTTEGEEFDDEENLENEESMANLPKVPVGESHVSLRKRVEFERRNVARISERLTRIKSAAKRSTGSRVSALREAWNRNNMRLNEAQRRLNKFVGLLRAEARGNAQTRPNGVSRQPAESAAVNDLRSKLSEQKLHNAKLTYANKLLQTEGLSPKQKAQIIKSLDQARSLREAKLLYENLSSAMDSPKRISESRDVARGSSSRATKSGQSALLSESVGATERWARLAGISK